MSSVGKTNRQKASASLPLKKVLTVALLSAVGTLFANAPNAAALSPWWTVGTVARPTYLHAGTSSSDVQEINVRATGGTLFLFSEEVGKSFGVPYNASAEVLERELSKIYPERTVEVSGGPTAEGSHYTVTFPGQAVAPLEAFGFLLELEQGGEVVEGEATVTPVSTGKPDGQVVVSAANLGDGAANGAVQAVEVGSTLPAGLKVAKVEGIAGGKGSGVNAGAVTCTAKPIECTLQEGSLPAYAQIEVRVDVVVEPGAESGGEAVSFAQGGGGPRSSSSQAITINEEPTPFGIENYSARPESEGGTTETQAGSHPFQFTTAFTVNQDRGLLSPVTGAVEAEPAALTKDLNVKLPPGLLGDVTAYPRCTLAQFAAKACQPQSAIGVAIATLNEPRADGLATFTSPVFNLEPNKGEPARFGFLPTRETPVFIDTALRTGGDYGVTASVRNVVQVAGFLSSDVTLWGVPGAAEHRAMRGYGCLEQSFNLVGAGRCEPGEDPQPKPFLRMPTSCTGKRLESSAEADPWNSPGAFVAAEDHSLPALDGCNQLRFGAQLKVSPTTEAGSTSAGVNVDVHVPQDTGMTADGLVPADVQNSTVTLPAGMVLNAAAAGGLQACSLDQVGLTTAAEATCPAASKVATVEIKSPLIENALHGEIYLANQSANPFGSLVALYLVASDPATGVLVKLAGKVTPDPATGQLVTTFQDTPQLPFEDLRLGFFDGSRAALVTPAKCGEYTTTATFAPWSANEVSQPVSTFKVSSGPGGSSCANPLPLAPGISVGTTKVSAAKFTPLTTTVSRADGQQTFEGITVTTPPGVSGDLTGVPLCDEASANQGTCGAGSLIGESTVSVGVGSTPFTVTGGRVYLTQGYGGAPFGLSIASPAKAGPYDLGEGACDCIVVRARVSVDPHTAALTVTTDASGPHKIPSILQGIPLNIRSVNVTVGREHFVFNPSNCEPLSVLGSISGSEGGIAHLTAPFQITNCAALKFQPTLAAKVTGKTSRLNGVGFSVKLSYPGSAFTNDSNIAKVKVTLPKRLPSRLTTLQKACLAGTFDTNPSNCPKESVVGHAKVTTPVLPVPLEGSAYFVSHANESFPNLTMVLKGYGLTIELVGDTLIRNGITTSTFNAAPDVPFSTFELSLPAGRYSALGAISGLCGANLVMPTTITAQDGAVISKSEKIGVTGCKRKKARKAAKPGARGKRKHGH